VKPEIKKSASKSLDLANVDQLETEHEVNSELGRLSTLLMKAHSKVAGKFYSVSVLFLSVNTMYSLKTGYPDFFVFVLFGCGVLGLGLLSSLPL
jgi:hypothetical protein